MSNNLPLIFILDIDNTLIGDSKEIRKYDDFITYMKNSCNRKKIDKDDVICMKEWKNNHIPKDFFRPYMKEFFTEIRKLYKDSEFFVFSLGTFVYVKDIVKLIENYLEDITFNKPYFSRENSFRTDTNDYVKDINAYESIIVDKLKHKYRDISTSIKQILEERTIIIDDINIWDDDYRHIKIKPYNYYPIVEYDLHLLELIYKYDNLYKYIVNSKIMEIERGNSFENFLMNYHIYMVNLYNTKNNSNKKELMDNTFKIIINSLKRKLKMKDIKITKDYINTLNKKLL